MSVQLPPSIRENLQFLVTEVDSQLGSLQAFFLNPVKSDGTRIIDRSGYAYNLKLRIHTSCLEEHSKKKRKGVSEQQSLLRAIEEIATQLERISELCRDCVRQVNLVAESKCLQAKAYPPMLEHIKNSIMLILPSIIDHDSQLAQKISKGNDRLRSQYQRLYREYIATLKSKRRNTQDIAHALFVAHSVEQMGENLLEISEAIISANIGQPVNIKQYRSLFTSLEDIDKDVSKLKIEPIAHTRSGSAISGVSKTRKNDDYMAVYKDGLKSKLKEEHEGVKNWHEIYPGLAPQILSYKKRGESASLMIEHLPGQTFEHILLHESEENLTNALSQLVKTLRSIWKETRNKKPDRAGYMSQLQGRLDEVYRIHPEFRYSEQELCGVSMPSFNQLVMKAAQKEKKIRSPFSVYIHGDFNLDNIIYDARARKINFIDLHRSCYSDYIQDISVFMVSNYRLQILDAPMRRRIMAVAIEFYERTRRTAKKNQDETFELRLSLALARSFATSTRFILDKSLSRRMFLRARYLLNHVLHNEPAEGKSYRLPIKEIFVG